MAVVGVLAYGQVAWNSTTISPNPVPVTFGSVTNALGYVPATNLTTVLKVGDTMTGTLVAPNLIVSPSALTSAASTLIDFSLNGVREITVTNDVTFATTNLSHGVTITLVLAGDNSDHAFTFPAWIFTGASAPAILPANKSALLWLYCRSAADTNVIASYQVQP